MKKVPVQWLKPGMYIAKVDSEWMAHPFLRSHFAVKDERIIQKLIQAGIHDVYIDPAKGLDLDGVPTEEEVQQAVETGILRLAATANPIRKVPVQEEMARARNVYLEAVRIIRDVMQDVRLGKQVVLDRIDPIIEEITESIIRNHDALLSLTRLKHKDSYTFQHSVAVAAMQVAFTRAMGLQADEMHLAGVGGILHDIGKVRIPDTILNKPARLTEDEFAIMKCHVAEGRKILESADAIHPLSIQVAYQHHERCDGSGYPEGLTLENISDMGKMVAICDVYDALTSDRVYHRAMEPHRAVRKIFEWSQFHFDPKLVQQFIRIVGIYPLGTLVLLKSGRIGIVLEQSPSSLLEPRLQVFYDTRNRHYLQPSVVDLGKPVGQGGADEIVGPVDPKDWGINPRKLF